MKSKFSDIFPHYLFLPPFAAVINAFSNLNENREEVTPQVKGNNITVEVFQDNFYDSKQAGLVAACYELIVGTE